MIIVEMITKSNPNVKLVVSNSKELFEILWIIDNSDHTIKWKIQDAHPAEFGWSSNWKKLTDKFTTNDYSKSS